MKPAQQLENSHDQQSFYSPNPHTARDHMTAISIYRQDRNELPTGTSGELAEELADALERGWL